MIRIEEFQPEVVILGAGDYPSHHLPLSLLRHTAKVQCCDGAAQEYIQREKKFPWRIVGDGDSLPAQFKEQHKEIVRQIDEQDFNDLTKNIQYAQRHGYSKIALVGITGKREDHTLGNISLLIDYMQMGLEVRAYTDHGVFIPCTGDQEIEMPTGSAVSIFNFGCRSISSEGLQYPLYPIQKLWQGTLNRTSAPRFTIHADGPYLLFLNF